MIRLVGMLALRSLWAHKVKSLFVGSILFFGTFLVVTGFALLNSIESAMERSITGSLAGQLQLYDANAKDPLELFGGWGLGAVDIGEIDDFSKVENAIGAIHGVDQVVPMGITTTTVFGRTALDLVLESLRASVASGDTEAQAEQIERVDAIVASMAASHEVKNKIRADSPKIREERQDLATVNSPSFWDDHADDLLSAVDFLDGRIAPLDADGDGYFLRVIGTDLEQFPDAFPNYYTVQGEPVPKGKQGFLFSNRTYESLIKNKVAHELDEVKEAIDDGRVIDEDSELKEAIRINVKQYKRIVYVLAPRDAAAVRTSLEAELGQSGTLEELIQVFLDLDTTNFERRYAFFYEEIAPRIPLYDPAIGDEITLRAFTKSGYMRALNVKIYGTYDFKGLEKADVWTASNLTDLVTFRGLYGKMNERDLAELDSIRDAVGAASVSRDNAEDMLFGGGGEPSEVKTTEAVAFDTVIDRKEGQTELWDPVEVRKGLALNAAVVLDDPKKIEEARTAIEAVIEDQGLGLQVVDWQTAAGMIGQYVSVMRAVLWLALFIIFLVALIIINNAMVSATLDRTAEIGTMRAIGAHRRLVVSLFVCETVVLGLIAGGLGALAGVGFILWLSQVGVPAAGEALVMLFAGPRLYPTIGFSEVAWGMVTILLVAVFSSLYPSVVASRIRPIVAMQGRE